MTTEPAAPGPTRSDASQARQAALLRLSTAIASAHDEDEICLSVAEGLKSCARARGGMGP
jgi:hypothetical protein